MGKNGPTTCTCWRRYRVCVVPLASVLAIVALGWGSGRWLFPQHDAATPRSITILDIPQAGIPDRLELHQESLPARSGSIGSGSIDSGAVVGKALKYSALVKWSAAMFFNLVLFVCALAIAGHILFPALREGVRHGCPLNRRSRGWVIGGVLGVLVVAYVLARWQSAEAPFTGLSRILLRHTVGSEMLADVVTQWDSIGICVIVMIAMAAGATLNTTGCGIPRVKPAEGDADTLSSEEKAERIVARKREIRMLARQTGRLRLLLYIGAVVLVFSLFETSSLFHLASVFTDPNVASKPAAPGTLAAGVEAIVSSLTMFRGFLYVLFLVGLYVPAAALIRTRSVAIARAAIAEAASSQPMETATTVDNATTTDEWLAAHGLTLTPSELLKPLLAITSPLLAVPFGELIGKL